MVKRSQREIQHDIFEHLHIMQLRIDLIMAELEQQRTNYIKLVALTDELKAATESKSFEVVK